MDESQNAFSISYDYVFSKLIIQCQVVTEANKYLNKHVSFSYMFAQVCMIFYYHPALKC